MPLSSPAKRGTCILLGGHRLAHTIKFKRSLQYQRHVNPGQQWASITQNKRGPGMSGSRYTVKLVADRDEEHDPHDWLPPLDRRAAVRMLSMTAVASILASCGTGSTSTSSGTTATSTSLT